MAWIRHNARGLYGFRLRFPPGDQTAFGKGDQEVEQQSDQAQHDDGGQDQVDVAGLVPQHQKEAHLRLAVDHFADDRPDDSLGRKSIIAVKARAGGVVYPYNPRLQSKSQSVGEPPDA